MGTINTEVIEYKDLSDGIYVYLYLHVHVYLSVRLHHVNEVLRMVSCRFSNTHRPTFIYKRKYIQTCMRTYCIVEYTMQNCACILSLGPQPVGFQCPFTSSLGEFHAFGTGSGILGYCPCWCPSPFPFTFHVSVFSHPLFLACHWISFVCLLYDRCTCICIHSVDPSLSHVLDEFPGLVLALGPDVVAPEAEQMCA